MSHPITLGAESVRAELSEAPDAHDLTPAQVERILALSDDQIDAAIHDAADDHFFDALYAVRRDAIAQLAKDPLVLVIHLSGDDYERAVDEANNRGGSTDAVAEHLSQWDYGEETDAAAEVNGHTDLSDLLALSHQVHEVSVGGLDYWLQLDHGLRFYALYRRPLTTAG